MNGEIDHFNNWSKEHDKALLEMVAKHGRNWAKAEFKIGNKDGEKWRKRYVYLCKQQTQKDWTQKEDHALLDFMFNVIKEKLDKTDHIPIVRFKRDISNRITYFQKIIENKINSNQPENQLAKKTTKKIKKDKKTL